MSQEKTKTAVLYSKSEVSWAFSLSCEVLPVWLFRVMHCAADCSCLHVMTCAHPYCILRAAHLFMNITLSSNPALQCTNGSLSSLHLRKSLSLFLSKLWSIVRQPKQTPAENDSMHFYSCRESLVTVLKKFPLIPETFNQFFFSFIYVKVPRDCHNLVMLWDIC